MTLEHLGGDRWRVRVYAGLDPITGRQRQRSRRFNANGPRAAERAAVAIRATLQAGIDDDNAHRGTVRELAHRYEQHHPRPWSPAHAQRMHTMLAAVRRDLGKRRVNDLTAWDVDQWYATLLARGLSGRTVGHYARALSGMLRQGQRWGLVERLVTVQATVPAADRYRIQPPTDAVVRLLIDESTPPLRLALCLAAHVGLRRGEVVGLRWADVRGHTLHITRSVYDPIGGGVIVKSTKSGRDRAPSVGAEVLAEFAAWRAIQLEQFAVLGVPAPADCFVFADLAHDATGQTPMHAGWLSQSWQRHRRQHGASAVRLHDLRHWNATALVSAGVPITTVSARLGHSVTSTTLNIYAAALPADDDRAVDALTRALGPGTTKGEQT